MAVRGVKVTQRYHVKLKKGEDGYYVVQCVELPAALSQGKSKKDAIRNIKEAIALVVEVLADEYRKNNRKILANRRRKIRDETIRKSAANTKA
jgi:predicted RNase H-like HicB family nuclease